MVRPVAAAMLGLLLAVFQATPRAEEVAENSVEKRVYRTRRVADSSVVLDGRLDEAEWETVEWAGEFTQRSPYDGQPPSQQTAFKILYDSHALYVGYHCFDSEPDKIARILRRRDYFPGDWVEINIDSYFDQRTAFSFTASASGVRGDEFVSNDGRNWDSNWHPIWELRTSLGVEGWTAEVRIPFSQLRFSTAREQVWGIQVTRRIYREEERDVWQYIPQDASGWVSRFGELHGISGIEPGRRIELLPYTALDLERFPEEPGNPFATGRSTDLKLGLDGKMGVTSDLTLDFTANPDFGQVEADPSQINLTVFETFFREQRPFFVEGNNILRFPLAPAITGGSFTSDTLFYSRRIGRSPELYPEIEEGEYVSIPSETTILGAFKLSGKTRRGLSLAFLDAITARERAEIESGGVRRFETVEPAANYLVARLQQDLDGGNTLVGGIFTATNRRGEDPEVSPLHRAAYAGGVDFTRYWSDKTWYVTGNALFSHVSGDEEAILETQTASTRYFQRPDAEHVTLDPTRTSLSGHSGSARVGRVGVGRLRFESGVAWRSPGFEINDLGFLRRSDEINQFTWVGYYINDPFSVFRRFSLNANQWTNWDFGGQNTSNSFNVNTSNTFTNQWSVYASLNRNPEYISNTELRGGPSSKWPGDWNGSFSVSSNTNLRGGFSAGAWFGSGDEDSSRGRSVWGTLSLRPRDSLNIQVSPEWNLNETEMQYVATETFDAEDRYLFGSLNQETVALTLRVDYCVTPNLTIQYYAQPFVSAGRYGLFKRISEPRADDYRDRFHTFGPGEISYDAAEDVYDIDENRDGTTDYSIVNPDFNFKDFNSNLVVRWEFRPGSTLYLVWNQSRSDVTSSGSLSYWDDMVDLFQVRPHDVFLVKVSHWFSW